MNSINLLDKNLYKENLEMLGDIAQLVRATES